MSSVLFLGSGGASEGDFVLFGEEGLEGFPSSVEDAPDVYGGLSIDLDEIPEGDSCRVGLEDLTLYLSPGDDLRIGGVSLVLGDFGHAADGQANSLGDIPDSESFITEEGLDSGLSFLDYGVVWGHFFIPIRRVDLP